MKKVLILGGTGFIGQQVCEQLTRQGIQVTVPTRRITQAQSIQTLPYVHVVQADIYQKGILEALVPSHDAVVNLIGILHGNQQQFRLVHAGLPRSLTAVMRACNVPRLIHLSALGASPQGPSHYQRSKAEGEVAVQSSGVDWTVLRPSVVFGSKDHFLNLFARLQAWLPVMLLPSAQARLQPVWVGDVARAITQSLLDVHTIHQTYELAGPQVYRLRDLVQIAGRLAGHERPIVGLPKPLGYMQAWLLEHMPGGPLMSRDNYASLAVDNVASPQMPGLDALGLAATPLEPTVARYLDASGAADPLLLIRKQVLRR